MEVALSQERVDKHTHNQLMSIGHTSDVLVHIDTLCVKPAIPKAVHDVVVEALHVNLLASGCRTDPIGKTFEHQMIAEKRQMARPQTDRQVDRTLPIGLRQYLERHQLVLVQALFSIQRDDSIADGETVEIYGG